MFVVDQSGIVRVLKNGRLTTFIDVRSRVQAGGEQGLLSIAFHPKFATNHRFFLYYNAARLRRRHDRRGTRDRRQGRLLQDAW